MEVNYGFTIDSTLIKEVTKPNRTSYTFFIRRDTVTTTGFENLVVSVDSLNEVTAVILKYTPTDSSIYVPGHDAYTLDATVEVTPVVYNMQQARLTSECYQVTTYYCDNNGYGGHGETHIAGPACMEGDMNWAEITTECKWVDAGAGGSGDGSSG
ncbi:hypothetical protein, partial [Neptunitalea chrysea]|uniref:hypothetical protein n=1 Tax=Neptunitalea chrysea TaxID=1647581 RepID=UPI002491D7B8